jgi:hypothetical protein
VKQGRKQSRPATTSPPPFGVGHLLLWVTGCAAYLAAVRALVDQSPGLLGLSIVAVQAAGYGAALAGLAIFISRRVRGRPWLIEPGEWLLALLGAQLVAELSIYRFVSKDYLRSPGGFLAALFCCLLTLPLLSRRLPSAWKLFFLIVLLFFARPVVVLCLTGLDHPLGATLASNEPWSWLEGHRFWLLPLLAAGLVGYELFRGRRRTWLHWAGLAAFVWYLAMLRLLPVL